MEGEGTALRTGVVSRAQQEDGTHNGQRASKAGERQLDSRVVIMEVLAHRHDRWRAMMMNN